MTEQEQAQALARWLADGAQGAPPDGIDPDALAAVYALRPDLAPPPSLTINDLLDGLTDGPFADGAAPDDTVVPFPVPASRPQEADQDDVVAPRAATRPWWRHPAAGVALALAATLLIVLRPDAPDAPTARLDRPSDDLLPAAEEPAGAAEDAPQTAAVPREDVVPDATPLSAPRVAQDRRPAAEEAAEQAKAIRQALEEPTGDGTTAREIVSRTRSDLEDVGPTPAAPPRPALQDAPGSIPEIGGANAAAPPDDVGALGATGSGRGGGGAVANGYGSAGLVTGGLRDEAEDEAATALELPEAEADADPNDDLAFAGGADAVEQAEERGAIETTAMRKALAEPPAPVASEAVPARRSRTTSSRAAKAEAPIAAEEVAAEGAKASSSPVDEALAEAARRATTDPAGAARALRAWIRPPAEDGQRVALAAARHALTAMDPVLAREIVDQGLALAPTGALADALRALAREADGR